MVTFCAIFSKFLLTIDIYRTVCYELIFKTYK